MAIFENGLATETTTVTVYGYSPETSEFTGQYDVRVIIGTGIPGFSTLIAPPQNKKGVAYVFNGSEWSEVTDYRGNTVYSTSTGEPVTVTELGDLRPGFTLTSPGTPYDKWDGEKWITDTAAQHAAAVTEANAKKSALLDEANAVTADWRTELALGIISDSDKAKLIAWMAYIHDVKATDTSTAPNVAFPKKPE
ncbi:tail fiber assembly protein [Edwardsiella tarda]|uniref:tail fiber assembly protein n=1 Tax=Edwardsiella tarda TaxID=636 RepID=UPI000BE42D4A|nr:tail fiber assembly protein [Edwardsiella tarda]ATI62776.1 phage tail protein [Edwardsiella tarda]